MKGLPLALVALGSQAVVCFAGPPPSKEVVAPPPPVSYFRGNEFDIGAFGTYVTGTGNNPSGQRSRTIDDTTFTTILSGSTTISGWGGGMDFTYYLPWKWLGLRFQGAGASLSTGDFTVTEDVVSRNGSVTRVASRTGSISTSAGVITSDVVLRLPLDDFWPGVHLAPYTFGGFGAIFAGGTGNSVNTRFPDLNARVNSVTEGVRSRPEGNIGGGLEYRFTPNIAIFGEAGYNFIDHTNGRNGNNFVQTNFGLRFAF
jgi:hypothetical protein